MQWQPLRLHVSDLYVFQIRKRRKVSVSWKEFENQLLKVNFTVNIWKSSWLCLFSLLFIVCCTLTRHRSILYNCWFNRRLAYRFTYFTFGNHLIRVVNIWFNSRIHQIFRTVKILLVVLVVRKKYVGAFTSYLFISPILATIVLPLLASWLNRESAKHISCKYFEHSYKLGPKYLTFTRRLWNITLSKGLVQCDPTDPNFSDMWRCGPIVELIRAIFQDLESTGRMSRRSSLWSHWGIVLSIPAYTDSVFI